MSRAVVDAKEFSHAMSKISKILKKCAIPILEEVCLRIQNGRCTLTATDLETWLTAEFPASGDDMFFAFRKTKDILRACSHFAGELTMEFSKTQSGSKKAGRVLLRCERRGAEFEVYDGADYPNMPQAPEGDAFSVSSARLSACVERVRYAAEKPSVSARPAAICVQFCGNRVYALDGTRLACDTLEGVSFPKPFLVRADVLAHLSAFGKGDMGFAKYASDQYAHRGSWSYTPSHTIDSAQGYSSDSELKVLLKGLGKGAYIRLHKTGGGSDHSVVIANADSSSVTVYEANYGWKCDVGMRTLTYAQFRNQYAYTAILWPLYL